MCEEEYGCGRVIVRWSIKPKRIWKSNAGEALGASAGRVLSTRVLVFIIYRIHLHCHPKLSEVAGTLDAMSAFASGVEDGKKYRNEEGDDGDDDEEFDESETALFFCAIHRKPLSQPQVRMWRGMNLATFVGEDKRIAAEEV